MVEGSAAATGPKSDAEMEFALAAAKASSSVHL